MQEQTQATEQAVNQTPQSQEIPNRRARRYQLKQQGILKYLSKKSFLDPIRANFRAETMKNGLRIQEIRAKAIADAQEEQFETMLESMKETWYDIGYNSEEMSWLEEAAAINFAKVKETRKEDKKEARELMKKARTSLAARQ